MNKISPWVKKIEELAKVGKMGEKVLMHLRLLVMMMKPPKLEAIRYWDIDLTSGAGEVSLFMKISTTENQ